jgi:hypothetical protein
MCNGLSLLLIWNSSFKVLRDFKIKIPPPVWSLVYKDGPSFRLTAKIITVSSTILIKGEISIP